MRKVSKKQQKRNRDVANIKKKLPPVCVICGREGQSPKDFHAAHLVPKSRFPEHYINPLNIVLMCWKCHPEYDNNLSFRKKQKHLIAIVKSFDELAANRYFDL